MVAGVAVVVVVEVLAGEAGDKTGEACRLDCDVDNDDVVVAAFVVVVLVNGFTGFGGFADGSGAGEVLAATDDAGELADNDDVVVAAVVVVAVEVLADEAGDKTGGAVKLTDELARCGDEGALFSPAVFFNCSILLEKNSAVAFQVFSSSASFNHCAFCGQLVFAHSDINASCC